MDKGKVEVPPSSQSNLRRSISRVIGPGAARILVGAKYFAISFYRNRLTAAGRANVVRLRALRDQHQGMRCVIIGNGPSLNETETELLGDEVTFGLNRIYMAFPRLGFKTTFNVVVNQLVVEQCAEDFRSLENPIFSTWDNAKTLGHADGIYYLNHSAGPSFSADLVKGIWEGATVTYVAMQIAAYMGFSKVVLVGVDHNFSAKGPAHEVVVSGGADSDHFDSNYFGKGFKWQLPDLETSEVAYSLAKDAFTSAGREIIDATVNGKLQVFPKTSLSETLK